MKDIIRKLNIMQCFLKQILDELQDLKLKCDLKSDEPEFQAASILTSFDFPLKSNADLIKFEEYLEDHSNFQAAVQELSKLGGANLYEFIKRVLTLILTNGLAVELTWYGMKGKKTFKNLKVAEALIYASEKYDKNVTKKDIEEQTRKWLRRARERRDNL